VKFGAETQTSLQLRNAVFSEERTERATVQNCCALMVICTECVQSGWVSNRLIGGQEQQQQQAGWLARWMDGRTDGHR